MVDAVLASTGRVQRRVRDLPSRVVVYLLLAAALFEECGYRQVWARLVAALDRLPVATPSASALAAARRRGGGPPRGAPFHLLAGSVAGAGPTGPWGDRRPAVALGGAAVCAPAAPRHLGGCTPR